MKLTYKHHVTVVSIPAGIKVGVITSREGAYLVTASTDPEIKAPSIIQANSELLKQFNVEHEYSYRYPWGPYWSSGLVINGSNQAGQQLSAQNYGVNAQAQAQNQNYAANVQDDSVKTTLTTGNWGNKAVEEIQDEVDKLVNSSGAV